MLDLLVFKFCLRYEHLVVSSRNPRSIWLLLRYELGCIFLCPGVETEYQDSKTGINGHGNFTSHFFFFFFPFSVFSLPVDHLALLNYLIHPRKHIFEGHGLGCPSYGCVMAVNT